MWVLCLVSWVKPFARCHSSPGVFCGLGYMSTLFLVSGNRSPTRPPQTSTEEAIRMGMALVMPTREPKNTFPITAASLHRALQKPKPVHLKRENERESDRDRERERVREKGRQKIGRAHV